MPLTPVPEIVGITGTLVSGRIPVANGGSSITSSNFTSSGNTLDIASGSTITIGANTSALLLSNLTSNWIQWPGAGVGAPTTTTRSAGTKLVVWPGLTPTAVDYGFGIDSNTLWASVPGAAQFFKWYAGTGVVAQIDGFGDFQITGAIDTLGSLPLNIGTGNASSILIGGNSGNLATATIQAKATTIKGNDAANGGTPLIVDTSNVYTGGAPLVSIRNAGSVKAYIDSGGAYFGVSYDATGGSALTIGAANATSISVGSGVTTTQSFSASSLIQNTTPSFYLLPTSLATSGVTLVNSPNLYFRSHWWNGSSSQDRDNRIISIADNTAGASHMAFEVGPSNFFSMTSGGALLLPSGGSFDVSAPSTLNIGISNATGINVGNASTVTQVYQTASFQLFKQATASGGVNGFFYAGAADTNLTASTEICDVNFNLGQTKQHATGALAVQRAFLIQAPTYSFVGGSIITTAATLAVSGPPIAGTNATITNPYALWVQSGNALFAGAVQATNLLLSPGINDIDVSSAGSLGIGQSTATGISLGSASMTGAVNLLSGASIALNVSGQNAYFHREIAASVGTPLLNSMVMNIRGNYWTGAASAPYDFSFTTTMTATTPAGYLSLGAGGVEKYRFVDTGTFQLLAGGTIDTISTGTLNIGGTANTIALRVSNTTFWNVNALGNLVPAADNLISFGSATARAFSVFTRAISTGNTTAPAVGVNGAALTINSQQGGGATGAAAGDSGSIFIIANVGGVGAGIITGGNGGVVQINGGQGGGGGLSSFAGSGGGIQIAAGGAGANNGGGGQLGGTVSIRGGISTNGSPNGSVTIGDVNTGAVNIGATGVILSIIGAANTTGNALAITGNASNLSAMAVFKDSNASERYGLDSQGLPSLGAIATWNEDWRWSAAMSAITAAGNTALGNSGNTWSAAITTGTGTSVNTLSTIIGSYPSLPILQLQSGTSNLNVIWLESSPFIIDVSSFTQLVAVFEFDVALSNGAAGNLCNFWVGLGTSNISNANANGMFFRKLSADSQWFCFTNDGATLNTLTTTSVTPGSNTFHTMRIEYYGSGSPTGAKKARFFIDGTLVATSNANLPTGRLAPQYLVSPTSTTNVSMYCGRVRFWWNNFATPLVP